MNTFNNDLTGFKPVQPVDPDLAEHEARRPIPRPRHKQPRSAWRMTKQSVRQSRPMWAAARWPAWRRVPLLAPLWAGLWVYWLAARLESSRAHWEEKRQAVSESQNLL